MHVDPILPAVAGSFLLILSGGLLLRWLKLPPVVAYLLAGIILGRHGLGTISNEEILHHLGSIGVILLLFFAGMEIRPADYAKHWRIPLLGTFLQVALSVGLVAAVGWPLGWPPERMVLIGFVVSLSSTAIVLKVLDDAGETKTRLGRDVIGILLMQDIAIIPMVIVLGLLRGETGLDPLQLAEQALGAVGLFGLVILASRRAGSFSLPFAAAIRKDGELQVFAAGGLCCGLALLSGLLGLSTAVGAFAAGMIVASMTDKDWIHGRLETLRIVFSAAFFVSIGMLVDLNFLWERAFEMSILVALALFLNTVINAIILRWLGVPKRASIYGGVLLSQIGEFSFVLAAVGLEAGIITGFSYNATLALIAMTLLVSPLYIAIVRALGYAPPRGLTTGMYEAVRI